MNLLDEIFLEIFNMSITASWLALAVTALRLIFKKAPKWINCSLWMLVALRLVCPFSPESALSLVPSNETVSQESFIYSDTPQISSGITQFNSIVNPVLSQTLAPEPSSSVNPAQVLAAIAAVVWLLGLCIMLLYALFSCIRLRKKVSASVHLKENQMLCDDISTPFILGIVKPRIYLPSGLSAETLNYVVSHEKAHLKRKDHLWKPVGFILLSVNWFNPVMWLSYILLCRDIELACDEKVIKDMAGSDKKAYSEALLSCSAPQKLITACPVAFGEVGVKRRIKSVLNYKKPAFWVILIALAVSASVAICFMTDPKGENGGKKEIRVYEIDEPGFPMYDIIMMGETFTVKNDAESYFDTFFGNGLGTVKAFLQSVYLARTDDGTADRNIPVQSDAIIEIKSVSRDTVSVCFYDDYSKLYIQSEDKSNSVKSSDYVVLNVGKVKDFFKNEDYKSQGCVWEYNPLYSTYGYGEVHLYVDEKYELISFEASEGTINEMTYKHNENDDIELHGIKWCPDLESVEADVKIKTLYNGEEVDFDVRITKVGVDGFANFYYISAEDSVIGVFDKFRYILSKPVTAENREYTHEEVYWDFNPYAGASFWYVTEYILPDGYKIKSAEASNGIATVDNRFYNDPVDGKCVKWSPDFYVDAVTPVETDLVIEAVKDGQTVEFKLKITEVLDGNYKSDVALKTYKITPVNCRMSTGSVGTYYLEEE